MRKIVVRALATRKQRVIASIIAIGLLVGVTVSVFALVDLRPDAIAATKPVVTSTSGFAYRSAPEFLTSDTLASADGNTNYSPASMWMALAIASLGADGATRTQMTEALGNENLNEDDSRSLMLSINGKRKDSKSLWEVHNSLWADKSTNFSKEFVESAQRRFDAETKSADFSDPGTARDMSKWISSKTHGMLQPEVNVSSDEVLSIINTLYADGRWESPFEVKDTTEQTFHGDAGDTNVSMMRRTADSGFAEGAGWQRADIAFDNGGTFKVLLPDAGSFDTFAGDSHRLQEAFNSEASQSNLDLQLPRFTIENTFESDAVLKCLQRLGITDAFDKDAANFSKLVESKDVPVFIGSIVQGTKIEVNESGAKAATFTKIGGAAMAPEPLTPRELIVDHPFLYEYDSPEGVPLFIGAVRNLSE